MATTPQPVPVALATGASDQMRQVLLRVAGAAMVLAGVVLMMVSAADLLGAFGDTVTAYSVDGMTAAATLTPEAGFELPGQLFLVIPLFLVGGVCLAVGLSGSPARAVAGCRSCGARTDADARFCPGCGSAVP